MEKNSTKQQKKLFGTLRELANIQSQNMIISFAIRAGKMRDATEENVKKVRGTVKAKAKSYGTKAQKLADDYLAAEEGAREILEYEKAIDRLYYEYKSGIRRLQEVKAEAEEEEIKELAILNAKKIKHREAVNARDTIIDRRQKAIQDKEKLMAEREGANKGDLNQDANEVDDSYDLAIQVIDRRIAQEDKKLKEADEAVAECELQVEAEEMWLQGIREKIATWEQKEKAYTDYSKDILDDIENYVEKVETRKEIIPRQNLFQKILGFFIYRFNRPERFTSEVIGRVNQGTKIITEKIPQMSSITTMERTPETILASANRHQSEKIKSIEKARTGLNVKSDKQDLQANLEDVVPEELSYL